MLLKIANLILNLRWGCNLKSLKKKLYIDVKLSPLWIKIITQFKYKVIRSKCFVCIKISMVDYTIFSF